jgi:hypothetical protein
MYKKALMPPLQTRATLNGLLVRVGHTRQQRPSAAASSNLQLQMQPRHMAGPVGKQSGRFNGPAKP